MIRFKAGIQSLTQWTLTKFKSLKRLSFFHIPDAIRQRGLHYESENDTSFFLQRADAKKFFPHLEGPAFIMDAG